MRAFRQDVLLESVVISHEIRNRCLEGPRDPKSLAFALGLSVPRLRKALLRHGHPKMYAELMDAPEDWGAFRNVAIGLMTESQDIRRTHMRLVGILRQFLYTTIVKRSSNSKWCIQDEGLLQRGVGTAVTAVNPNTACSLYFQTVPVPETVVLLEPTLAEVESQLRRRDGQTWRLPLTVLSREVCNHAAQVLEQRGSRVVRAKSSSDLGELATSHGFRV